MSGLFLRYGSSRILDIHLNVVVANHFVERCTGLFDDAERERRIQLVNELRAMSIVLIFVRQVSCIPAARPEVQP